MVHRLEPRHRFAWGDAKDAGSGGRGPDDADSLRRLDPDAWDDLFVRMYPRLVAYASPRVGAEAAKDVAAETFARALADIDHYNPGRGRPEAWVFGIGAHVITGVQRADRHRSGQAIPDVVDPDPDPEEVLDADGEASAVRAAFGRLRAKDRDLLELRVVAQLEVEDVAVVLHKRPGAVRTAQSRALGRLRSLIKETNR